MSDDGFVKIYIQKFEHALLDHVRKQIDSETKVQLYEAALQDLQRKLEESDRTLSDTKAAFDQSLHGLQAVTLDKDELKAKHEKRETEFELVCAELATVNREKMKAANQAELLQQKLSRLEELLAAKEIDIVTMKTNYNIVLANLEKSGAELERAKLNKKKKATTKDSEWIDGDEISG